MSLFLQVNFVSRNDKADIISQHFPELFDPVFDLGEAIGVRNVIDKYCSIGISVQGIFNEIYAKLLQLHPNCDNRLLLDLHTVFPHIVSVQTIPF